jgi:ankyrin repeat protein
MSAALKDEKISEILIKKGADIDAAIFYFQRSYSTDVVKFLLTLRTQLKIKNVNVKKDGNTKLHLACENIYSQINFSIVHELINPSNDSKYQDTDSAQYLNVMITPEDPNKTNHRLETALMVALKANGDPDETANITTLLFPLTNLEILDLYYGRTAFMWVCLAKKQIKSFDALYSRCYDFEQPDKEGHTPFLLSVIGDALHYIEKLIQKPVNVSALNNLDEDALMLAGKKENNSVGKMLITYGVPINRISKKTNKSALNLAIENKNIILCFALIASRLLFCIAREILPTPNVKTLDFLFEQGGHLNQRDERGQTLFHVRLNDSFFAYVFQLEGAESCKSSAVDFSGRNVETALKENKKVEYNFKDISNNLSTLNGLAKEKNQNPIWQKLLPLCQKVLSATEPAKNVVREESSTADDVNTKQKSSQSQSKKSNKSAFFSEPEEAAEVKRKTTETPPIKEDIPVKKKHRL